MMFHAPSTNWSAREFCDRCGELKNSDYVGAPLCFDELMEGRNRDGLKLSAMARLAAPGGWRVPDGATGGGGLA